MRPYKIADWGVSAVNEVQNQSEAPLFKTATLNWSRPTRWSKEERLPSFDEDGPFVYALVRNHHRSASKDHIEYIGLTTSPASRFGNHRTAKSIVNRRGEVGFSFAPVAMTGRNREARTKKALEEIEHLLIWAVWHDLHNERKTATLPGMGTKQPGSAWHITNTGYRFAGRMPREIVYPWMLIKPGRDRSRKGG